MIEVTIEKLVHGGKGLARHDGLTLFIPGVLPGEKVVIEIKRRRKDFAEASLIEVIKPSPDRTIPLCNGEEECTGATWAHISYPAQLRFKEEILLEVLRHTGKIEPKIALPIIPSPYISHYRKRVQFNVRYKDSRPLIGFFREGTHDIVEIKNGLLLHPIINNTLDAIRNVANRLPPMKEIHINAGDEKAIILFFVDLEEPPSLAPVFEILKRNVKEVAGIVCYANKKKWEIVGKNNIRLKLDDIVFQSTESGFFQVNWSQNRNMVDTILKLSEASGSETVLDLYCGIGNFALPFAGKTKKVIGIESGYSAIEDAKINAANNGIENVEFICDDVGKGLKSLLERKEKANIIILDPPRAGATGKILERAVAFSPKKILYVSCNPSTLARDIGMLSRRGYTLNRLQPIDMFPHTYHIETIAEMVR